MRLGDKHKVDCLMVYIEVAVSNMMLDDSALGKMINHFWEISPEDIQEFVRHNSLGIADVKKLENLDESIDAMLAGNAVFFIDGYDKAMKISSKGYPSTGVMEAESEKVLRVDKERSRASTSETDSSGGTRQQADESLRESTVLVGSSGSGEPVVEKELAPEISGIVISAQGGGNASVQKEISEAMQALFGLPAHKIKVLKRVE